MSSTKKPSHFVLQDPDSMALFKRSAMYFWPYRYKVVLATAFMIMGGLCDAATAWLVKPALDEIFINKNADALLLIPLAYILVTLFKAGAKIVQNYYMQWCGLRVLEVLRDEMYHRVVLLPLNFFENAQIGMLMARIVGDVGSIRASMPALVMIIRQVVTLFSLVCVVFYQNWQLAIWAMLVLPLAFFPFIYFGKRMRKLGRKGATLGADISSLLQEVLSGIRVVKAFSTEEQERERFDQENKRLMRFSMKSILAGEFSSSSMEVVGALGVGIVIWIGGMQVLNGESTPGTFFSFVAALVLMYDPIKKLSASNINLQSALAGAERVFGILDNPELQVEKGGERLVELPFQELRFENVRFAYPNGCQALDEVNFSVKAGQRLAIVGPSGAGKSTFVNLIPRFYSPQSGRILLNGHPIEEYDLKSLRSIISMVSQDNFLFNISIADNIGYGLKNISPQQIEAAARAAYCHDFIMDMPEGYDSVIGERGVKLSGGQKQRLTIARALVKDAPLLILDEATSALDSESEHVVQQALDNLMENRTSIVIAHRLSTIIGADSILVMDKGRVAAQGTHAELLVISPLYAKLYEMQFNLEEEGDCAIDEVLL
ncbi:ATP-binding cassette domain-containing protein [Desulfovibrio sp. OttesenSCG-928-F20]|nr:ATP-binding cassette domain-containing protein [Desulfovibrio sp. OttesenSCG-928-F20]